MALKLGMTVDLCMAYILMLISMTLTLTMKTFSKARPFCVCLGFVWFSVGFALLIVVFFLFRCLKCARNEGYMRVMLPFAVDWGA